MTMKKLWISRSEGRQNSSGGKEQKGQNLDSQGNDSWQCFSSGKEQKGQGQNHRGNDNRQGFSSGKEQKGQNLDSQGNDSRQCFSNGKEQKGQDRDSMRNDGRQRLAGWKSLKRQKQNHSRGDQGMKGPASVRKLTEKYTGVPGLEILLILLLLLLLGWLCFRNIIGSVLMLLFLPYCLKLRKAQLLQKRRMALQKEFRGAMASLYSFTAAGGTLEKAIRDTCLQMLELQKEYPVLLEEFKQMCIHMDRNMSPEEVFTAFAERTEIPEIMQFAEILEIAGKSGGALSEVVRSSAEAMSLRMEINEEIETMLSGRKGEFLVMMAVPPGIMIYMNLCSPEYMSVMYTTLIGKIAMLVSVAVYVAAVALGRKFLDIKV